MPNFFVNDCHLCSRQWRLVICCLLIFVMIFPFLWFCQFHEGGLLETKGPSSDILLGVTHLLCSSNFDGGFELIVTFLCVVDTVRLLILKFCQLGCCAINLHWCDYFITQYFAFAFLISYTMVGSLSYELFCWMYINYLLLALDFYSGSFPWSQIILSFTSGQCLRYVATSMRRGIQLSSLAQVRCF